jgi:hypothetical protein
VIQDVSVRKAIGLTLIWSSATRLESVSVVLVSVIAITESITITTSKTVVSINGLIVYALLSKEIVIKQSPAVFSPKEIVSVQS